MSDENLTYRDNDDTLATRGHPYVRPVRRWWESAAKRPPVGTPKGKRNKPEPDMSQAAIDTAWAHMAKSR